MSKNVRNVPTAYEEYVRNRNMRLEYNKYQDFLVKYYSGTEYQNYNYEDLEKIIMGIVKLGGQSFDPSNIPGSKLAEIGQWALTGKKLVDDKVAHKAQARPKYTDIEWLNDRVQEVCEKGRL